MAEGARDDTAAGDATDASAGSADPVSPPASAAAPPSAAEIAPDPAEEPDLGRRRFFRQLASDVFQATATVVGAANALQQTSIQAASAILDPASAAATLAATGTAAPAGARGFRTAFRVDGDRLIFVD